MSGWNPLDKNPDITLSAGNTVATHAGASHADYLSVRSFVGRQTGKRCFRVALTSDSPGNCAGALTNTNAFLTNPFYLGVDNHAIGMFSDGASAAGSDYWWTDAIVTGSPAVLGGAIATDVLWAVDLDAKKIWTRAFAASPDGPWNQNPAADPATGTGGLDYSGFASIGNGDTLYIGATLAYVTGSPATATIDPTLTGVSLPAGFHAWDFNFDAIGAAAGIGTAAAIALTSGIGQALGVGAAAAAGAMVGTAAAIGAAAGTGTAAAKAPHARVGAASGAGTAAAVGAMIGADIEARAGRASGVGEAEGFMDVTVIDPTPEAWPSTLNALPTIALAPDLTVAHLDEIARVEMDRGPPRLRPRFTQAPRRLRFEMLMTAVEFAVMKGFYTNQLRHGTLQFVMPLWNGQAYADTRARFAEPYEATDFGADRVHVRLHLVTFEGLP